MIPFLEDPPHDVVYQNEDGRWVTDLAYYTSFNKEEVSNFSNLSGDFVAGCKPYYTFKSLEMSWLHFTS